MSGVGAGPGFEGQHLNDAQWSSEVKGASTGLSSTSLNKSPSVFIVMSDVASMVYRSAG